jgi:IclR family pca regulon transcriptional regulator
MGKLLLAALPDADVRARYRDNALFPMTRHTITDLDALLQHLRHIRDTGYAIAEEELELGLWGIAVPLTAHDGTVLGAISVSVPKVREPGPDPDQILPQLRACATAIERDLCAPQSATRDLKEAHCRRPAARCPGFAYST